MFIEINGLAYNLMFAQSIDKLDEDGKYKILYAISNENKLVEEFDNEADRDAKYELAQEASSTAGIKEEIEQIEQDIQHLQEIGFHPLVVEELPEDPEEFILYLVPAEDFEETNIYNEFLYVNNEWEQIGTTGVDLSGYYTKEEIDSSVIKSIIIEQSFSSNPDSIRLDENNLTKLNNFISTLPQEGAATIFNVWLVPSESVSGSPSQKNDYVTFFNIKKGNPNNNYTAELITLNLNKYDNKVASTTTFVNYRSDSSGHVGTISSYYVSVPTEDRVFTTNEKVLTKTNTTAFTPTADYHPATKKYVDDLLANIDLSKVTGFINLHNNSSNNPLVLSTLEPGMYIVSNDTWSGASFTMVARPGNRSTTIFDFDLNRFACLFIENKIPEVYDNVRRSVYLSIKDADKSGVYIILDDGYSLTQQWNLSKELLTTSTSQTITSKKTFNTLPESSVTPTTNNQLTNKAYVDTKTIQYSTMPTADSTTVGKIVQYIGTTDNTYTNGYFYVGTSTTETVDNEEVTTYSWEQIDVQPAGQVGINKYEINLTTDCVNTTDSGGRRLNNTDKQSFSDFITWAGNQTTDFYLQINLVNQPTAYVKVPTTEWEGIPNTLSRDFYNVFTMKYSVGTDFSSGWQMPFILTGYANGTFLKNADRTNRGQAYGSVTSVSIYYRPSNNYAQVCVSNDFFGQAVLLQYIDRYALGLNNSREYTPTGNYHPATKKYVDDAIAAAITDALGGSY